MLIEPISPEDYELLQQQKEKAFAVVDRIQERNANREPEEVLEEVTKVVEEVRQQQYDQR